MKILFKNRSFGGGAPKSLLAYIKTAQKNGFDVLSIGAFNYEPVEYLENGIRTINLPYFVLHKPLHNFKVLKAYLKLISVEKPDIIHTTTLYNIYFQYLVEKLTNIPSVYMIPGGQISPFAGKILANMLSEKEFIVYSEENRQELLGYKVKDENIQVISNRIDFNEISVDKHASDVYRNRKLTDTINMLLITRFSETKINSIRYTIQLAEKLAKENVPVELTILGSGYFLKQIKEEANEINQKLGQEIIKLPGYQNNVEEYVRDAHLIFGKGRSVIDGIMQNKLSAVVNEDNQVFICTPDNFDQLSDYNLTGRNTLEATSYEELKELCRRINSNDISQNEIEDLYEKTKLRYDINVVEKDIVQRYESLVNDKDKDFTPSTGKIIRHFIVFYFKILIQLLKK